MVTLYNKSKYLKINKNQKRKKPKPKIESPKNQQLTIQQNFTKRRSDQSKDIIEHSIRAMMALRTVSINYNENKGPFTGFMGETQLMGMDPDRLAPGYDFALVVKSDILEKGIKTIGLIPIPISSRNRLLKRVNKL